MTIVATHYRKKESNKELSKAERLVYAEACTGKRNLEIARDLHLSLHTIKWHLQSIYSKLGLRDRIELLARK